MNKSRNLGNDIIAEIPTIKIYLNELHSIKVTFKSRRVILFQGKFTEIYATNRDVEINCDLPCTIFVSSSGTSSAQLASDVSTFDPSMRLYQAFSVQLKARPSQRSSFASLARIFFQ